MAVEDYMSIRQTYFFHLATLEIISVGAGLVKMLGVEAELFVTIDDSGVVRATVSINIKCLLKCIIQGIIIMLRRRQLVF